MLDWNVGRLQKVLMLVLAGTLPLQATYGEAPTTTSSTNRKVEMSARDAKQIVRAQSPTSAPPPDKEASDAAVFDSGLPMATVPLPAGRGSGWNGYCSDLPSTSSTFPSTSSPQNLNQSTSPNAQSTSPNNANQPSSNNAMTSLPGLQAGQGQSTAQGSAPAFFGDFFSPSTGSLVVPGGLIPSTGNQTPFAIALAQPIGIAGSGFSFAYLRQLDTPTTFVPGGKFYLTDPSNNVFWHNLPNHAGETITPIPGSSFVGFIQNPYNLGTTTTSQPPFTTPIGQGAPTIFAVTAANATQGYIDVRQAFIQDSHNEFNTAGRLSNLNDPNLNFNLFAMTNASSVNVYSPSVTGGGIQKLVENSSPIPRDRVFLNYNYFDNAQVSINGQSVNVNRLTPGFEKTFFGQRASIEVRVPFATNLSNVNLTGGSTNTSDLILGNQTTYLKSLLYTSPDFSLGAGLGVQAPTAQNTNYSVNGYSFTYDGTQPVSATTGNGTLINRPAQNILQINNQAWHLLPYVGAVYTPDNRRWLQAVGQFDFATNGNSVYGGAQFPNTSFSGNTININSAVTPFTNLGTLRDTNFMYLSANGGYWMYKVMNPYERGVTGFAPTVEIDYNQSLQRSSTVQGIYGNVSSPVMNQSIVNGIIGATTVFGHDKYLSVAYVAPFTTGVDRVFDGELRVMFNYYFGPPRVNPRFSNVPGT